MTDPNAPTTELTEIVVFGRRTRYEYQRPLWMEPPIITNPGETDELPPEDPGQEPAPQCLDTTGMSDADKLKALLRFAAAVALAEIKTQPNQNREYGVLIYESGGQLRTTAILQTTTSRAQIDWAGLPNGDYTTIRGFLHSHPCTNLDPSGTSEISYFNPGDPAYLLRPSPVQTFPDQSQGGDWLTFDGISNMISLQHGSSDILMFIAGCDGSNLQLNEYTAADRGYTSDPATSLGSDGQPGARGSVGVSPLPPCSE